MLARLVEYDPAALLSVLCLFGMRSAHEFELRAIWADKSMCGLFIAIYIVTCDIKVKVIYAS
jgi:hypothetical protein